MTAPSIPPKPAAPPPPSPVPARAAPLARRADEFRQLVGDTLMPPLSALKSQGAGVTLSPGRNGFVDALFTSELSSERAGERADELAAAVSDAGADDVPDGEPSVLPPLPARKPPTGGAALAAVRGGYGNVMFSNEILNGSAAALGTAGQTTTDAANAANARVELAAVPRPGRKPLPPATLSRNDYAEVVRMVARTAQVPPEDLMAKLSQESNFRLDARSRTSSAAGPFQFVEGTWLSMVRRYGAAYGLGAEAEQIHMRKGKPVVDDPAVRKQLLDLRHNLDVSAGMAARYLSDAGETLNRLLHRPASGDERRLAFLLGPAGASRLIKAAAHDPQGSAAGLLPDAARANRSLFYAANQPLSNRDAHARMIRMMGRGLDTLAFREERQAPITDLLGADQSLG